MIERGVETSLGLIERLYRHMEWADRLLLDRLTAAPSARTDEVVRLFSHLLAAERVWLLRLRGENSAVQPIWPILSLAEMGELAGANRTGYRDCLAGLRDERLVDEIAYTNQHGVAYRTAIGDVLLHVAMHGSYHRGQAARAIRQGGEEPVNTDFITFVREGAA